MMFLFLTAVPAFFAMWTWASPKFHSGDNSNAYQGAGGERMDLIFDFEFVEDVGGMKGELNLRVSEEVDPWEISFFSAFPPSRPLLLFGGIPLAGDTREPTSV